MGTTEVHSGLLEPLLSPVQQRVLGLLFGQPDRSFQSAELIRLAQSGTGAVHRLLTRLAKAGLVTATRSGNQKYYQANRHCPLFPELHGLVLKTVGLVAPLAEALAPLRDHIALAFVYGSTANGTDRVGSDVDLLVVSDTLTYPDVFEAVQNAETTLGRPVNPTVMSSEEWRKKAAVKDSFAARVAAGPRLLVIGTNDAHP